MSQPHNAPPRSKYQTGFWWRRMLTRQLRFALDVAVLSAAFILAYLLRFDFALPPEVYLHIAVQLPYVAALQLSALGLAGVYVFIWRYIGITELKAFFLAALCSCLPVLLLRLSLPESLQRWRVPVSVIVMDALLAFGGVFGLRVLRRIVYERQARQAEELRYAQRAALRRKGQPKRPVLLIGAGRAGLLAAKEIKAHAHLGIEIKGFVDDDPAKLGQVIYGVKVLGNTTDLPRLVQKLGIDHAVITIAEAAGREVRRVLKICEQIPLKVRIIPALYEILSGQAEVSRIRDVQIEDLLGRAPVALDEASMQRLLAGKRVMVTGAGGSIGSELARQVACLQPASLLLVERAECALFDSERELRRAYPELTITPLIADITDDTRMRQIFAAHQPQVVLHAAAHKHVPMMECNAAEAIKNNVLGTRSLAELADIFEVEVFVLISTDKAVRPSSVMGASKRVAELVVQDINRHSTTRFVAVRFGNVIGSAGSVLPIFREQIRRGGPITVTHPDMTRYFMTIPEAAQLVLQAGAIGAGGEIFILDMGEPVRILELAKDLIRLSGLRPFEDIDISFTGERGGEKLFEELQMSEEGMTRTRHPKISIGKITPYPEGAMRYALERLAYLAHSGQERELRSFLSELLPEARLSESTAFVVPPSGGQRRTTADYAPAAH